MNSAMMEDALRDSSEFLKAQHVLGHGSEADRESEVNSLCEQILEIRSLDKPSATRMSRALATMDWTTAEQLHLASAVNERSQE